MFDVMSFFLPPHRTCLMLSSTFSNGGTPLLASGSLVSHQDRKQDWNFFQHDISKVHHFIEPHRFKKKKSMFIFVLN